MQEGILVTPTMMAHHRLYVLADAFEVGAGVEMGGGGADGPWADGSGEGEADDVGRNRLTELGGRRTGWMAGSGSRGPPYPPLQQLGGAGQRVARQPPLPSMKRLRLAGACWVGAVSQVLLRVRLLCTSSSSSSPAPLPIKTATHKQQLGAPSPPCSPSLQTRRQPRLLRSRRRGRATSWSPSRSTTERCDAANRPRLSHNFYSQQLSTSLFSQTSFHFGCGAPMLSPSSASGTGTPP